MFCGSADAGAPDHEAGGAVRAGRVAQRKTSLTSSPTFFAFAAVWFP